MNALTIKETKGTPKVTFNPDGELFIEGRSLPENPSVFYLPVLEWIKNCKAEKINLHLKLDYMNTSSSRELYTFFNLMKENPCIKEIKVNWFYEEDDDEAYEMGCEFETLTNLPFQFNEYAEALE